MDEHTKLKDARERIIKLEVNQKHHKEIIEEFREKINKLEEEHRR